MKNNACLLFVIIILASLLGCSTPLMKAAGRGNIDEMNQILIGGGDINEESECEGSPLIMSPLNCAIDHDQIDAVKFLLDRGANLNNSYPFPPIINAAYENKINILKFLLERGANPNAITPPGRRTGTQNTVLGGAALYQNVEIMKILIAKGAKIDTAIKHLKSRYSDASEFMDPEGWKRKLDDAIVLLEKMDPERIIAIPPSNTITVQTTTEKQSSSGKSDVDELPSIRLKPNKNSYAIVIGIEQYRQKLPRAEFAAHDAKIISEYLTKTMGYPEENVITLLNDRALKSDMEKYFDRWLSNNVEKNGRVFIYYSGHGAPNANTGDAYLVPYDGDPTFIAETGYPITRLYQSLGKLKAKEIIVVLDSCFSGGGGRSVLAKGAKPLVITINTPNIKKNISVITASSGDQISSAYEEKGHGLFTYFLLKGIKNEDVVRQDGSIKMDDLFDYIKPQVERIARKQFNNEQTPQLIGAKKN